MTDQDATESCHVTRFALSLQQSADYQTADLSTTRLPSALFLGVVAPHNGCQSELSSVRQGIRLLYCVLFRQSPVSFFHYFLLLLSLEILLSDI